MDRRTGFTQWVTEKSESGQRLQAYLSSKLETTVSLKQIKHAIENNACQVNGFQERFASYRVKHGDVITFYRNQVEHGKKQKPVSFSKDSILYEDSEVLVYNKAFGCSSDAAGLYSILLKNYPGLLMVHRLDKETSGAIIYAKHEQAQRRLIESFRKRKVNKEYLALVDGILNVDAGEIREPIGKIKELQNQSIWGPLPRNKGGSIAITAWKMIEKGDQATLLKCMPITGRTHQIRVHLSHIGHPLLGDKLYCHKYQCSYHAPRHFLHAVRLSFPHPSTRKNIKVQASLPKDLKQAIQSLFKCSDQEVGDNKFAEHFE